MIGAREDGENRNHDGEDVIGRAEVGIAFAMRQIGAEYSQCYDRAGELACS